MVKLVKLISGEDIFCEVESIKDLVAHEALIRMKHPMVLMPLGQGPDGKTAMTFIPWLQVADNSNVEVRAAHVLLVADVTNAKLVNAYQAKTGGIVTAQPCQVPQLALPG